MVGDVILKTNTSDVLFINRKTCVCQFESTGEDVRRLFRKTGNKRLDKIHIVHVTVLTAGFCINKTTFG